MYGVGGKRTTCPLLRKESPRPEGLRNSDSLLWRISSTLVSSLSSFQEPKGKLRWGKGQITFSDFKSGNYRWGCSIISGWVLIRSPFAHFKSGKSGFKSAPGKFRVLSGWLCKVPFQMRPVLSQRNLAPVQSNFGFGIVGILKSGKAALVRSPISNREITAP